MFLAKLFHDRDALQLIPDLAGGKPGRREFE
jgi:hypothetical protein